MVRGAAIRPAASRTIRQAQGRRRETLFEKEPTQGAQGTDVLHRCHCQGASETAKRVAFRQMSELRVVNKAYKRY